MDKVVVWFERFGRHSAHTMLWNQNLSLAILKSRTPFLVFETSILSSSQAIIQDRFHQLLLPLKYFSAGHKNIFWIIGNLMWWTLNGRLRPNYQFDTNVSTHSCQRDWTRSWTTLKLNVHHVFCQHKQSFGRMWFSWIKTQNHVCGCEPTRMTETCWVTQKNMAICIIFGDGRAYF